MILKSLGMIITLVHLALADDEPKKPLIEQLIDKFDDPKETPGEINKKIRTICGALWENQVTSRCTAKKWKAISTNWEIKDTKDSTTYMKAIENRINTHTQIVYNITKRWIPFFDSRARDILAKNSSSLICSLAAYKWFSLEKEESSEYFYSIWQSSARKCTSYLAKVRASFMCMICDKTVGDKTFFKYSGRGVCVLGELSCHYFLSECMGYIKNKRHVIERLNREFVLSLCDQNGVFIARGAKSSWKKIMPSATKADQSNIEVCSKFLDDSNKFKELVPTDPPARKEELRVGSEACRKLCERYFSVDMMIQDDIDHMHNMDQMHTILYQVIEGKSNSTTYDMGAFNKQTITLDFSNYLEFKFKDRYLYDKSLDYKNFFLDKTPIEMFKTYFSISNMNNFAVTEFVKFTKIVCAWFAQILGIWVYLRI